MKRMALLTVILGVVLVQQASLGHFVNTGYINWNAHGYGCGTCSYYSGECIFYTWGKTEAVVPTAPVYLNTGRTLNAKWYWYMTINGDPYHPNNLISYKWCSHLEWKKPFPAGDVVLEDYLTEGKYYVYASTPASGSSGFTDTHLPTGFSRTMTPTGTHTLVSTVRLQAGYPETNTYYCPNTSGWHTQSSVDSHTFTVQ